MKLKLNKNLRRALCTAVLSLTTWTTTVGSATLVASQLLSSQAMAADVSFTGSADENAPSEFQWNADAAFGGNTFAAGDNTSFTGYTDATLSAGTTVGTLSVTDGALDIATAGNALSLGDVNGAGSLTLDGATSITGDVNFTGDLVIASGTTTFGTNQDHTKNIEASSIQINSGAEMHIGHTAADWSDSTAMILNGGTLHSLDMGLNSNGGVQFGELSVLAESTISHKWNGVWSFTSLTGDGNINFNTGTLGGGEAGELRFAGVTDYNGTIIGGNGNGDDYIRISGVVNQSAGKTLAVTGSIPTSLDSVTFKGEGAANFGAVNLSGSNTQESGTVTMGTVTFESADASLNALGGTTILSHTSYSGSGTISAGAAEMQFSAASDVTVSTTGFQLGAHGGTAGTAEAPLITTVNVGAKTVSITSSITDVAGSVGGMTIDGTGTLSLSGNNTFSGGVTVNSGALNLARHNAAGTGTISVGGGALNMNGLAVANTVNYSAGTISGTAAFAGTLNVNAGTLALDAISGSVNVASGAALTLSGTWDFTSSMSNAGMITLADDILIDLQGINFAQSGDSYSLTLFTGATGDAALLDSILGSGTNVDLSKFTGLQTSQREYSYADGVLSYTTTAQNLVHASGPLSWQEGTSFDGGSIFATGDNVTFTAGDITVASDVEAGTIIAGGEVNFLRGDADATVTAALVDINGMTTIADGVTLQAGLINVNEDASLSAASIGTSNVILDAGASLEITTALATGANALNNISSTEANSTLKLSLSSEGSSVEALNFGGALHINSGVWDASAIDVNAFTSAKLLNSSVLDMSAANLGGSASMTSLLGDADSMIKAAFSTDAANGTNMQLGAGFTGSVEVLTGTISARYSNLGGASKLILNNGTGLVFNQSNNSHTFSTDISLADAATVTMRAWGGTGTRTLSGAITGAANTVINKTDGGTIAMSDLTGFAGTINIAAGTLEVNSNANLNSLTIAGGAGISIAANMTVTAGADNARHTRDSSGSMTVTVGTGATLTENVYWRIAGGTFNVQGGGTYVIENFLGTALNEGNTTLNIATDTTLKVMGETNETRAEYAAGFMLGNWNATGKVNVNGTLDLHSGLSNQNGTGEINIGTDGTLILRKGLYGTAETTQRMTINSVADAKLQLGNQTSSSDTINTNIAAGTNIIAMDETTNILNTLQISGTGNVNITATATNATVNFDGAISHVEVAEGATPHNTGLAFSGTSGQTFNLNTANSYTGGTTLSGATLSVKHVSALGEGAVTMDSGTLQLNGHAVTNDVTAASGTLSGFGAYAGTLTVSGAVSVSDRITGSMSITSAGALTLDGVWDYSGAITNAGGSLTLASDLQLDLTGATFAESAGKHSLELMTGTGTANVSNWLTGASDLSSILKGITTVGRTFSYENGVLSYTIDSKALTYEGGNNFVWGVDTTFTTGGDFAQGDTVTFSGSTKVTLSESVSTAELALAAYVTVSLTTDTANDFVLNAGALSLGEFASMQVNSYALEALSIDMATRSSLFVDSIGTAVTTLDGTAHLHLTDAFAAGDVSLDHVTGGTDSQMSISANTTGTTLSMENFAGTLNLKAGALTTDRTDFDRLAGVTLSGSTSYAVTGDAYGDGVVSLTKVTGGADTSLALNLSTRANHGTELQMGADFTGKIAVNSGMLSAAHSSLGSISQIVLNHGSGIVFDQSGASTVLAKAVHVADAATVTIQSWGSLTESYERSITGAITGAADTRINKTDGGQLLLSNLTDYQGTIDVQAGKITTGSDAELLSKVLLGSGAVFEVETGLKVVTHDGGNGYYTRASSGGASIIVNAGASFTDNVRWTLNNGTYNVEGTGTYTIDSFLGTSDSRNNTTLNIASGTHMVVLGTTTSNKAANSPAFMLANYNASSTVNLDGTLTLNSGISNQDGTGTIKIGGTGTLVLNQGLYGVDDYSSDEAINIQAATGATLKLANQSSATTDINTDLAAGATVVAIDADADDENTTVNITNTLKLSGTGAVNLSAESGVTALNVNGAISQVAVAEGETAHSTGLAITTLAGQTVTLNGQNSYTGGTTLSGAGTVTAGSVLAFSSRAVTLNSGTLNANAQALTNDVTVNGGSIQGFSAYAGNLTIAAATTVSDQITGSISVAEAGALTLTDVWDYSSAMDVAGSVTFGADLNIDLTGVTFAEMSGVYSLNLFNFTGTGSADLSNWLTDGSVNAANLTGYTAQEGYVFSYENGVLTYASMAPPTGDIEIDPDRTEGIAGSTNQNIIFTGESGGGIANLGAGFSQGEDSVISGTGQVIATANNSVELSGANTYTGDTVVKDGATLTVASNQAMGESDLTVETGGTAKLADGVSITNNLALTNTGKMETGVFTLGAKEDTGTAELTGASKLIAKDSITSTDFTAASVALAGGAQGTISGSTLTNTAVTLGDGSELTLSGVTLDANSSVKNNSATLIVGVAGLGVDAIVGNGTEVTGLTTLEKTQEDMHMYTLTSLSVTTLDIDGQLTLNILVGDASTFESVLAADGMIGFELQGVKTLDGYYGDVLINVYGDAIGGAEILWSDNALGYTTTAGGNIALYIPEPSTATLSLLALAGLLARRRRKVD